jgi:predicted AAA+ superfamily ATPase
MKRRSEAELRRWKVSPRRKPLLVRGARQVGKTFLLKEFGNSSFPAVHYVNFEEDERATRIFAGDLKPTRILDELRFLSGRSISPAEDLIILDEIQRCPRALTALKYFAEELRDTAVCAAGSLLGVCLGEDSFPVGKVSFLDLFPLSFEEFLDGCGEGKLAACLRSLLPGTEFSETAHERLWELKSGTSTKAKSLTVYQQKYAPSRALLLGGRSVWRSGNRFGWPLYAAGMIGRVLDQTE